MNIAILGPSGVGKGSHAANLCSRFRLRHVATGDLFRDNLENHTALGILARKYMSQGELVPDEIVDAMIEEWLGRLPGERGMLLDGFPRTLPQARFLDDLLARCQRTLDAVICLQAPDEEIISRLAGRFICRNCQTPYHQRLRPPQVYGVCDECGGELYHRPDDSMDLARTRLKVFHRAVAPVLEHYANAGKLILVSGEGTMSEVDAALVRALESVRNRSYRFATPADLARLNRATPTAAISPHLARTSLDIVVFGPPGSGKGTQAERLAARLKLPHVATGNLFRDNLRRGSKLGALAKTYMDRGELVPDDVTDAMVEERLIQSDAHRGFVLDGFPRTLHQAHALTEFLTRQRRRLSTVLCLKVADDLIVQRLSGRLICERCQTPYHENFHPPHTAGACDRCGGRLYQRPDDSPSTVRSRLVTYHRQTEPLLAYFRDAGLLREIDGTPGLDVVFEACLAAIPTGEGPENDAKASQSVLSQR